MREAFRDFAEWLLYHWNSRLRRNAWILVVVAFFVIAYGISQLGDEVIATPCSPGRYPARCYRISESQCNLIWKQAAVACKSALLKLDLPPTRLRGPIMNKCQVSRLDRIVVSSRVSDGKCADMHRELEEWRRSNPELL